MTIQQISRRAQWSAGHLKDARAALTRCAERLEELERHELAANVAVLGEGLGTETQAQIVVAGDFKSGKSALVNALVGHTVVQPSPISTSTTPVVIKHGETARYHVVRPSNEHIEISHEEFQDLAVADPASRSTGKEIAHLLVELPAELLKAGITLIDTPNLSGGLSSPAAGTVLGYVHVCNALLFVTDASQELTAAEAEFIDIAKDIGDPVVICALTKTDLYPDWRRIKDANHRHLSGLGTSGVVLPVSPLLFTEGLLLDDPEAVQESGIEVIRWYLTATLVTDLLQHQARSALLAALRLTNEAHETVEAELAAVGNAGEAARLEARLLEQERLLERLSNSINNELQHEIGRYQTEVTHALERALAEDLRPYVDDLIDRGDPLHGWPGLRELIVTAGSRVTADHLRRLDEGLAKAIETLSARIELEAQHLGLDQRPNVGDTARNANIGDLSDVTKYRMSNAEVARAGMGGLMSAAGTVGILATLFSVGALLTPLSAVAGVAGLVLSVRSTLDRRRESDVEESRRKAKDLGRLYVGAVGQDLREKSRNHQIAVSEWTHDALARERENVRRRTAEEIARVQVLLVENEEQQRHRTAGHRQALDLLDEDIAQLKRLVHLLARPEMEPVRQ